MGDDLGPPPAPKPVQMPPMPPAVAQKFGAAPMAGPPMMMGGCPTVGGMGPNLVFNFCSPYGMAMPCPPPAEDKGGGKEEKEDDGGGKPKTVIVQGDPTWCQPRVTAKKGNKLKDEPCVIM